MEIERKVSKTSRKLIDMKGICFIEPLHEKTVKKIKIQTRRIMSEQPDKIRNINQNLFTEKPSGIFAKQYETICPVYSFPMVENKFIKPRYNVGEILYLKEPYNDEDSQYRVLYKFDNDVKGDTKGFWKNKLFMPADCARHFIKIISVHAEKLQDISDEDCIKEGIIQIPQKYNGSFIYSNGFDGEVYNTSRQAYAALIDKINGKGTWDINPCVWVYDYELIEKP
jgi:hypothetical protein